MLQTTQDSEFDTCYQILCDVTAWLNAQRINQWLQPLPKNVYLAWQQQGYNFHLKHDGEIVGVASLVESVDEEWISYTTNQPVRWLYAMAVDRHQSGRGFGSLLMREIAMRFSEPIWTTCVNNDEHLPNFYKLHGYVETVREHKDYGEYGKHEMVLLVKK